MLAEIHNKISQSGSNLSDRLEDKLTGDFFGTIRYLSFEKGLIHIFKTVEFNQKPVNENWLRFIEGEKGYTTQIEFWHRDDEGEIDLLITNENVIIGVEVKYLSGLSSEDPDENSLIDEKESVNQLARYSRMLERLAKGRTPYLLFLAPYDLMNTVKKKMSDRSIISPDVELGFMCWEDIHESLSNLEIDQWETGPKLIIRDLLTLLMKKGLTRFRGFRPIILDKPIVRKAYYFEPEEIKYESGWNWPKTMIKEDLVYVYNNIH